METQATQGLNAAAPAPEDPSLKAREVKVWHAKDAKPGNQVDAPKSHVTLAELSSALSYHLSHQVPHPTDPGEWVTRKSFRLFIEHELIPGSEDGSTAAKMKPIQGMEEVQRTEEGPIVDGQPSVKIIMETVPALHGAVKALCGVNRLTAKVLAQTATGAEVEFTRA